jgi:hypothetical protein
LFAQNTALDGDWKQRKVVLRNTAEAELMIRVGDIDNLGFGWPAGYDPFSGKETPPHSFPWEQEAGEAPGLDMIMLPSSMSREKGSPCGGDGYSDSYEYLMEKFRATTLPIEIPMEGTASMNINGITMMLFIDDFQSPVFCSQFEAYLNGRRAVFLETLLNQVTQTGPIGKLITVQVPPDFWGEFKKNKVELLIDDRTTGAHDGFALDFVKVLINPKALQHKGTAVGKIIDQASRQPVVGAEVNIQGFGRATTNERGEFSIQDVPAGLALIQVCALKYRGQAFQVDIIENQRNDITLELDPN